MIHVETVLNSIDNLEMAEYQLQNDADQVCIGQNLLTLFHHIAGINGVLLRRLQLSAF